MSWQGMTTTVLLDIENERARQVHEEGFDDAHDDNHHADGSLAQAAAAYAFPKLDVDTLRVLWPWWVNTEVRITGFGPVLDTVKTPQWFKPKDRRRDLVRAGALIVAEIERLDREEARQRLDADRIRREQEEQSIIETPPAPEQEPEQPPEAPTPQDDIPL